MKQIDDKYPSVKILRLELSPKFPWYNKIWGRYICVSWLIHGPFKLCVYCLIQIIYSWNKLMTNIPLWKCFIQCFLQNSLTYRQGASNSCYHLGFWSFEKESVGLKKLFDTGFSIKGKALRKIYNVNRTVENFLIACSIPLYHVKLTLKPHSQYLY